MLLVNIGVAGVQAYANQNPYLQGLRALAGAAGALAAGAQEIPNDEPLTPRSIRSLHGARPGSEAEQAGKNLFGGFKDGMELAADVTTGPVAPTIRLTTGRDLADTRDLTTTEKIGEGVGLGASILGVFGSIYRWGRGAGAADDVVEGLAKQGDEVVEGAFAGPVKSFVKELDISDNAARRHLRRHVPGTGGQAHHILPWELRDHEVIKRAARGGFNINGANNGIRLNLIQHLGSHPKYNAGVRKKLDRILADRPGISDADAATAVQNYVDILRDAFERIKNKKKLR